MARALTGSVRLLLALGVAAVIVAAQQSPVVQTALGKVEGYFETVYGVDIAAFR